MLAHYSNSANSQLYDLGICYSESPNPTRDSSYVTGIPNGATFKTKIKDLKANTEYYLRAYTRLEDGEYYSENVKIKTNELFMLWNKGITAVGSTTITKMVANSDNSFTLLQNVSMTGASEYTSRLTRIDTAGTVLWSRDFPLRESENIITINDGYIVVLKSPWTRELYRRCLCA